MIRRNVLSSFVPFGLRGDKSVEVLEKFAKTGDRNFATNNPIQNIPYRIVAKEAGKDRLEAEAFEAELGRLMGK